jgi:hypothetical protein
MKLAPCAALARWRSHCVHQPHPQEGGPPPTTSTVLASGLGHHRRHHRLTRSRRRAGTGGTKVNPDGDGYFGLSAASPSIGNRRARSP